MTNWKISLPVLFSRLIVPVIVHDIGLPCLITENKASLYQLVDWARHGKLQKLLLLSTPQVHVILKDSLGCSITLNWKVSFSIEYLNDKPKGMLLAYSLTFAVSWSNTAINFGPKLDLESIHSFND